MIHPTAYNRPSVKSQVAALKTVSVARLELCAILLNMSKLVLGVTDFKEPRHHIDHIA